MATLKKAGHEAFAQALAKDIEPKKAYAEAGYRGDRRLARDPRVVNRVAEILQKKAWSGSRDLGVVIDALKDAFEKAVALGSAAGMVAARGLMNELVRVKLMLPRSDDIPTRYKPLSDEEWTKLYGPSPP